MKKLIFALGLATSEMVSAAPNLVAYQGAVNKPDGVYPMVIRICTQERGPVDGTTCPFEQRFSEVPVTSGTFGVILGGANDTGSMLRTLLKHNDFLFLEVQVSGDAALVPRQPLVSAPYSIAASEAAELKHAVVAFASDPDPKTGRTGCPFGWSPYEPAAGRFIRGLDVTGGKTDPDGLRQAGETQEDAIKTHKHPVEQSTLRRMVKDHEPPVAVGGEFQTTPAYDGTGLQRIHGDVVDSDDNLEGSSETRPKNVALLYCIKN